MWQIRSTQKIKPKRLKWLITVISIIFLIFVSYFLYQSVSNIRWSEIENALGSVSWKTVAWCFVLTILNYFIYACYDILSFNIIRNAALDFRKIISSTMIAFAFNLNLGALIGSIGLRYRIYSGWGIPHSKITLLTVLSIITSWSGYVLLLSGILLFKPQIIGSWLPIDQLFFTIAGVLALACILLYLFLCFKRQEITFRDHHFHFPPLLKGLLQLLLSSSQWLIVSLIIWIFLCDLGAKVSFEAILFSVLLSGIAGVITHIPAGLGILETVFLKMHQDLPVPQVIAALFCYRFVYYMIPLAFAVPGYLYLEYYQKHQLKHSFWQSLKERFKEW